MTPERIDQLEDLYHAAREYSSADRELLLAAADPDLRREVEVLLLQSEARSWIDHSPGQIFAPDATVTPVPMGTQFGSYTVDRDRRVPVWTGVNPQPRQLNKLVIVSLAPPRSGCNRCGHRPKFQGFARPGL